MPELRTDLLTGTRVIIAPERSARPNAGLPDGLTGEAAIEDPAEDPFAAGNEHQTPDPLLCLQSAEPHQTSPGSSWLLRVVPNLYPLASADPPPEGTEDIPDSGSTPPGSPVSVSAFGTHEVVIECPDPRHRFHSLSVTECCRILIAWQRRIASHRRAFPNASPIVFRNEGPAAGASLKHCHSQIIAFQTATDAENMICKRMREFRREHGGCLVCRWAESESSVDHRVIRTMGRFVLAAPFASRFTFSLRIAPFREGAQFSNMEFSETARIASLLYGSIQTLRSVLGPFAFNLGLHEPHAERAQSESWWLDITPRLSGIAGLELCSGLSVCTVSPETAAEVLREAWSADDEDCPVNPGEVTPAGYHWVTSGSST